MAQRYAWPGNIRELKNVVERMAILTPGDRFTADAIPLQVRSSRPDRTNARESAARQRTPHPLDQTEWNVCSGSASWA